MRLKINKLSLISIAIVFILGYNLGHDAGVIRTKSDYDKREDAKKLLLELLEYMKTNFHNTEVSAQQYAQAVKERMDFIDTVRKL